jgi:hypothetical protein
VKVEFSGWLVPPDTEPGVAKLWGVYPDGSVSPFTLEARTPEEAEAHVRRYMQDILAQVQGYVPRRLYG